VGAVDWAIRLHHYKMGYGSVRLPVLILDRSSSLMTRAGTAPATATGTVMLKTLYRSRVEDQKELRDMDRFISTVTLNCYTTNLKTVHFLAGAGAGLVASRCRPYTREVGRRLDLAHTRFGCI